METQSPSILRFFFGALGGSVAAAAFLSLAGFLAFEEWEGYVEKAAYLTYIIAWFAFPAFLIVGLPMFLLTRKTRFFRLEVAAPLGALVGLLVSLLFGPVQLASVVFAGAGLLAVWVCWLVLVSPNKVLQRTRFARR